jgi:ABC-2 type transport system permease protein
MTLLRAEAPPGTVRDGIRDIVAGIKRWPVWWTLTWYSMRSQYRRTYVGPWWMTLQQVIFVAGLSVVFGLLFKQDLTTFVPYVAIGYIAFTWMTGLIQGGAGSIVGNAGSIKTTPGPLSILALRSFASSTLQFMHDAVVIVAVVIIFGVQITWSIVLVPVAVALIAINGVAGALWIGPLCARYRDVGELTSSVVRILFFLTPIFWVTTDLSESARLALVVWNPIAYFLELFRAPLLGQTPSLATLIGAFAITAVNVLVGVVYFSRSRDRLAYWL